MCIWCMNILLRLDRIITRLTEIIILLLRTIGRKRIKKRAVQVAVLNSHTLLVNFQVLNNHR